MIYNSLHINDGNIEKISYQKYVTSMAESSKKSKGLKHILINLIPKRARLCLIWHYHYGKNMKEISENLNVSVSTVSRDIKLAKSIIEKNIKLY